ncbi:MAG TPA: trypsin-like peptidase domain-containing protein [Anaerolineaceae bacterium]|nr:trypsin-like peptidase domain-containing protein [Anaerolineaceae bacterium]HPN51402.1 trypsin-like peptidase domain-containing protein [Anaerolineaceae bacterium]
MKAIFKPFVWLMVLVMLVSLACNLPGSATPEATKEVEVTKAPTKPPVKQPTKTPEAPEGLVTSLDGVQSAVIQIEAQGTFVDPAEGLVLNAAGRGSGFIIDPSGIAVTNNHVVTGAALLKVWVGGDKGKVYNARVLGASECSDLAVIDIEGDGFPYLEWYDGEPKVGLEVYSAGFPLGDPEYTLGNGIVSKATADGSTSWASINHVIEHTAKILPGNSGGPLVDKNGKVVAINYASNQAGQYFAISHSEADEVIKQMREEKDVTSIGVNGTAFITEDGSLSGIWVSSVKSGSPADKARIQGGDIITQIEGLALSTDGTMSDYCDILRSHKPQDTLSVSVLRYSTQEVLEGQLNGRTLEVVYSFAQELSGEMQSNPPTNDNTGATYSGYYKVQDDSGTIQVEIPVEWSDVDGSSWDDTWTLGNGQKITFSAPTIRAAANQNKYYESGMYQESGIVFTATPAWNDVGDIGELLDFTMGYYQDNCKYDSRNEYSDEVYEGAYDLWKECGPDGNWVIMLVTHPKDMSYDFRILVEVKITKEADLEALDHIFATFDVIQAFE